MDPKMVDLHSSMFAQFETLVNLNLSFNLKR